MKKSTKLLSLLLCGLMLLPSLASCNDPNAPTDETTAGQTDAPGTSQVTTDAGTIDVSKLSDEEYFATYFTPALRFTVASDVHIDDSNSALEEARLAKLFEVAYKYASEHESYKKLDAALFCGDITNHGRLSQMKKFKQIMEGAIKEETKALLIMGNHEFYDNASQAKSRFNQTFGDEDGHEVIGGFHFIRVSPDANNGNNFSAEKRAWLDAELKEAAKDDPTKPIFVMQHQHVSNTVLGSVDWGVSDLTSVLKKYPQIIHFSGHSHFPMQDPTSIWQGTFTALGTGGLSYTEMGLAGVESDGIFPTTTPGGYVTGNPTGNRDLHQYYIVEVSEKGEVQIMGYDLESGTKLCHYYVRTPSEKSSFRYKSGWAKNVGIAFPENAAIAVSNVKEKTAKLAFPAAVSEISYGVQNYRVELTAGGSVKKQYVLAHNHLAVMPTEYTVTLSGLKKATEYTVKIIPVDVYGKDAKDVSLTATFTTEGAASIDPVKDGPDVFDLTFEGGEAFNGATGDKLEEIKNPTIENDASIGMDVVSVSNGSVLKWTGISDYYADLSSSITMTTYLRLDKLPPSGQYYDLFSNQQAGGAGFEVTTGGKLQFYAHIGGDYTYPETDMVVGEWVHLTMTYDGKVIKLYVNGVLAASKDASGGIHWPDDERAHYLVVGGDSFFDGQGEAGMTGSVAKASVWSTALTADQVKAVYEAQTK